MRSAARVRTRRGRSTLRAAPHVKSAASARNTGVTASIRRRNAIAGANAWAARSRTTTPQGKSLRGAKAIASSPTRPAYARRPWRSGSRNAAPTGGVRPGPGSVVATTSPAASTSSVVSPSPVWTAGRRAAKAGSAGSRLAPARPVAPREIHERDEEKEAARAVLERRQRGRGAATCRDRLLRGGHRQQAVIAMPALPGPPTGFRRADSEEDALEKRR